jgi:hypothetical protein
MSDNSDYEPPIEFALGERHLQGVDGWRSLSQKTGLPIERIAYLGRRGELRSLFGDGDGLRSPTELRNMSDAGQLGPPIETRALATEDQPGTTQKPRATAKSTERGHRLREGQLKLQAHLADCTRELVEQHDDAMALRDRQRMLERQYEIGENLALSERQIALQRVLNYQARRGELTDMLIAGARAAGVPADIPAGWDVARENDATQ